MTLSDLVMEGVPDGLSAASVTGSRRRTSPAALFLRSALRELTTWSRAPRTPEPSLVVDDPLVVDDYVRASVSDPPLAPVRLLVAALASEMVAPGQTVLDLGCGPASELALLGRLHPRTRFIGVELSAPMLRAGRELVDGLENVELRQGDITRLDGIATGSADVVLSTFALHHLPHRTALHDTFAAVRRVLRPGGGLSLFDLGRLRSRRSVDDLARRYAKERTALFTADYWHSMRAAFSVGEMTAAARTLEAGVFSTFFVPFMLVVRRMPDVGQTSTATPHWVSPLARMSDQLGRHQRSDLDALVGLFRLGGLRTPVLRNGWR